ERERLGAVGAAGAPGADPARPSELREHVAAQDLELLGVAPELRDVDRHAVEEAVELVAVAPQDGQVLGQGAVAARGGERAEAALNVAGLLRQEADRADAPDRLAEVDVLVAGCLGEGGHALTSRRIAAGRSSRPWTPSARPASATARGMP